MTTPLSKITSWIASQRALADAATEEVLLSSGWKKGYASAYYTKWELGKQMERYSEGNPHGWTSPTGERYDQVPISITSELRLASQTAALDALAVAVEALNRIKNAHEWDFVDELGKDTLQTIAEKLK